MLVEHNIIRLYSVLTESTATLVYLGLKLCPSAYSSIEVFYSLGVNVTVQVFEDMPKCVLLDKKWPQASIVCCLVLTRILRNRYDS